MMNEQLKMVTMNNINFVIIIVIVINYSESRKVCVYKDTLWCPEPLAMGQDPMQDRNLLLHFSLMILILHFSQVSHHLW